MPKFSEFVDDSADEVWEGCFDCQTCGETVMEAKMNVSERLLTWKCSKKHVSFIKDFPI